MSAPFKLWENSPLPKGAKGGGSGQTLIHFKTNHQFDLNLVDSVNGNPLSVGT